MMIQEERIAQIEKELSRVRRINRWLLAALCLCFGVLIIAATAGSDKVIRANHFILVDENGKERADLGMDTLGPSLRFMDKNGEMRVMLAVTEDGSGMILVDDDGAVCAMLTVDDDGPGLILWDEHGKIIKSIP